ncbi:MAG TPA: 3'-5' exonuclease [Lentimicrobium sp.]|nr:3'-5' exonuclease [Lentimicrobium sp.]
MLENIKSEDVLFLDIETVSQYANYHELPETLMKLWEHKAGFIRRDEMDTPESLYSRAGIYSEFGKIICISVGFLRDNHLRIKSFAGDDEFVILSQFAELLNRSYNKPTSLLCAHNGKEFDYPYISRRMLVNGLKLPAILDICGCKPWEIRHMDTLEFWKFGDHKNYTSLALLTTIFGIESPKDDIDGSQVGNIYWNEKNLDRIKEYCQKDVIALVQLFLRFRGYSILEKEEIIIVQD